MSGGGTAYPFKSDPQELGKILRESEEKAKNQDYEISINEKIDNALVKANQRNTDKVKDYLSNIKTILNNFLEGTIDIRYGGSISKHTFVDGLSDIDTLALINNSNLSDKSPDEIKKYFSRRLKEKLPEADIKVGKLAVTITFKDKTEIQILPAIKIRNGFKIQSATATNQWTKIEPRLFAKSLRAVNIRSGGKVIPLIKLIKSIIYQLPEKRRMSGYHIEASAIEVFKSYEGTRNKKEMLKYFFEKASQVVLVPIKDKTGQSAHVDDYAGKKSSLVRRLMSDSLSNIHRKILNADATNNISFWDNILTAE